MGAMMGNSKLYTRGKGGNKDLNLKHSIFKLWWVAKGRWKTKAIIIYNNIIKENWGKIRHTCYWKQSATSKVQS